MRHEGIAHRINAERLMVFSWGRAILLQLAHPLIAAGVADHSALKAGPHAAAVRLRRTVGAMLSLTFGGEQAHMRTIEAIRQVHTRVNGHLREAVGTYPAGTRYSAEDPDLVLWVHSTLIESVILAYDDLVAPLDVAERDAYCGQARRVALALGARAHEVPHTWDDLVSRLDATRRSGAIIAGPDATRVAAAVLSPPLGSLVWPMAWINRTLTIGTLPDDIRAQYGFRWTPQDARRLDRTRRLLRAFHRRAPDSVARWAVARQ